MENNRLLKPLAHPPPTLEFNPIQPLAPKLSSTIEEVEARDPESFDRLSQQIRISLTVRPLSFAMLLPIDLDAQPCFRTIEIEDIRPNRHLPFELEAELLASDPLPKDSFADAHLFSQFPGTP